MRIHGTSDKKMGNGISWVNEMKIPLNQLRAFEAAARHASFTQAANEISLTQSAVSQQIRTLEQRLGSKLFEREHRSVRLTREGEMLAAALVPAFQQIDYALNALANLRGEKGLVRLLIYPTHARRVLIPRLPSFYKKYPGVRVQITASHWISDQPVSADLAVRDGFGGWPGVRSVRLHGVTLTPVCSPQYLDAHPLNDLHALNDAVLLESQNRLDDWPFWRNSLPVHLRRPPTSILFGNSDLAYEAALGGTGVAMGQISLLIDDLRAGRLVAPFPYFARLDRSFFLLINESAPAHIGAFADWFSAEIADIEREVESVIRNKAAIGAVRGRRVEGRPARI